MYTPDHLMYMRLFSRTFLFPISGPDTVNVHVHIEDNVGVEDLCTEHWDEPHWDELDPLRR